jgi:hypothetical protein
VAGVNRHGRGTLGREQKMIEIKNPVSGVADRQKWAAHGASFVAKVKATKTVWFPPKPEETGRKAGAAAKKATGKTAGAAKKTTSKSSSAAKKTTRSAAGKPRKKANGPARKTAGTAKKATSSGR